MLENHILHSLIRRNAADWRNIYMKAPEFFVVKKKKSLGKAVVVTASAVVTAAAAAAVVYKVLKNKIKTRILGQVDIDGDGEADVFMVDTTGDGEFDTIILNTESSEEEIKLAEPTEEQASNDNNE